MNVDDLVAVDMHVHADVAVDFPDLRIVIKENAARLLDLRAASDA